MVRYADRILIRPLFKYGSGTGTDKTPIRIRIRNPYYNILIRKRVYYLQFLSLSISLTLYLLHFKLFSFFSHLPNPSLFLSEIDFL